MNSSPRIHAAPQIDAALAHLGRIEPPAGFEARLTARIAAADAAPSTKVIRFPFGARVGATAAVLAAAAMLLVANDHTSRHISLPPTITIPAVSGGFGPAGRTVKTAGPMHPAIARSGAHPVKGRAVLAPKQPHKAGASAMPRTPLPANPVRHAADLH